ncbi:MAG: HD domain-containing phosphohydrolase [Planctomycetota bacterium]
MNRRVLVVDDSPVVLGAMKDLLGGTYDVHTAATGEEALHRCEEAGPFAVVLSDYEMPAMNGIELLAKLEKTWPDTTRMMITGYANLDLAVEALRSGSIFRFLSKSAGPEVLRRDVEAGVERFRRVEEERLLTEQLQFSRESLLSLTETLEQRLADQLARLRGMHHFAARLRESRSLEEVATLTAETATRLLGGRAVEVEMDGIGRTLRISRGGEPGAEALVEPIVTTEGIVGQLRIETKDRRLAKADREVIGSIVDLAAVAAHNHINRHWRDSAQHATIYALARLAEFRDDDTGKHLERVAKYCALIARGLREDGHGADVLSDSFLHDLELSAPLHDIGKVGVPDSILLKPGELTPEEWAVMRKHATIGAETLRNVLETSGEQSFLRMGHEIAWCHHERWNGSGYPRGLAGEEIPLSARIMALADCYDALTTRRPYKDPWTHAQAMAYVAEQRGLHFDPHVVDAFVARADQVNEIRRQLADEPFDAAESIAEVA